MLIDHVGIDVADLSRSRAFYEAALAPLGVAVMMEVEGEVIGLAGREPGDVQHGKSSFWIAAAKGQVTPVHVAFQAGGRDNGGPGLRPHYHPGYYAAFILDPDGHNVEAVCHTG